MSEETVGVIQENPAENRWEVLVNGELLTHTKTLAWVKCNMRKSTKVLKSGVKVFDVIEDGETTRFEPFSPRAKKVKVAKKPVKPEAPATPAPAPVNEKVTIEGLEKLSGHTREGLIIARDGKNKLIIAEFTSVNGESVIMEFHSRSGMQKTENPYHKWRIVKSA